MVSLEKLRELHSVVCQVLEDRSKAEDILPTQGGFFFGCTEYDDYYFKDLEDTKRMLEALFKLQNIEDFDFEYCSSW